MPCLADYCAPGATIVVDFEEKLEDEDAIQHYSVMVDGQVMAEEVVVDDTSYRGQLEWVPPGDAQPGDDFLIRVEARDIAGNVGFASVTLSIA